MEVLRAPTDDGGEDESVAPSPAARRRAWDDVPLRTKVTLVTLLALTVGTLVGTVESWLGHSLWPMVLGLAIGATLVIRLACSWVVLPIDRLAHRMELLGRGGGPATIRQLPVERHDEVGQMARAMRTLSSAVVSHDLQLRQLRRTLDHRIESESHKIYSQLQNLAMRDDLTRLGNRRLLEEHLDPLIQVAWASDTDLLCVLIDIDDFKQVNDTLGHAAGDEVLTLLSTLIRGTVRQSDLAVRLGGDEFVVIMPGASLQRIDHLTESLRKMFVQHLRATMGQHGLTPNLSIGVASLRREGCQSAESLLSAADRLLYEAKRTGKARTAGLFDAEQNAA